MQLKDEVHLRDNPICTGIICAKRYPTRYEIGCFYDVLMSNGTILHDRHESTLCPIPQAEIVSFVAQGMSAMPVRTLELVVDKQVAKQNLYAAWEGNQPA